MSRSSCRSSREKHHQYHPTDWVYDITHLICSVRVSALSNLPFLMTSVRPIIECDRRTMFKTYDNDVSVSCMVHASPRVTGARVHWRRTKSGFNSTLAHGENERYFSFEQLDEVGAQQWHCVIKPRVCAMFTLFQVDGTNSTKLVLNIKKMFPQNFRKYIFEAENELGSRKFVVTLVKGEYCNCSQHEI